MKNPLRLLKLYQKASAALGWLDQGRDDWETRKTPGPRLYVTASWWAGFLDATRDLLLALPVPDAVKGALMKNWKTTLAGVSALLALATKIVTTGQFAVSVDIPVVLSAIGLIFAKDANVTGGTVTQ